MSSFVTSRPWRAAESDVTRLADALRLVPIFWPDLRQAARLARLERGC